MRVWPRNHQIAEVVEWVLSHLAPSAVQVLVGCTDHAICMMPIATRAWWRKRRRRRVAETCWLWRDRLSRKLRS